MRYLFLLLRFALEICVSAALVAAMLVGEWSFVSAYSEFFAVLAPFGSPALFLFFGFFAAPFVALPAYGLAQGRPGLLVGSILSVVIVYSFHSQAIKQEDDVLEQKRAALTKLAADATEPMRADHTLLAIEDDNNGSLCDEACIKVLATSEHTLALRSESRHGDRTWILYRQAKGSACFAKENAKLSLQFLLRGFPDKCATQTSIPDFEDGLFLRRMWSRNPKLLLTPGAPEGFTGEIYESYERIDGHDRLLTRYIKGSFESTLDRFPLWKRPPGIDAGTPIDRISFLAKAVGSDVNELRNPAVPFPFGEVLTGTEKYFDQREAIGADTLRSARWAWLQVATNASLPQAQLVRDRILQLFATHDLFRTELGIEAITRLRLEDRTFPDDVMLDLVFVPISSGATASLLEKQLDQQFAPGRLPPTEEVRERARAHLADPDLKPWQLRILNQISLFQ